MHTHVMPGLKPIILKIIFAIIVLSNSEQQKKSICDLLLMWKKYPIVLTSYDFHQHPGDALQLDNIYNKVCQKDIWLSQRFERQDKTKILKLISSRKISSKWKKQPKSICRQPTRIFIFKVRASGSDWMTNTIVGNYLHPTHRNNPKMGTQFIWEPFSQRTCFKKYSAEQEEESFVSIMKKSCVYVKKCRPSQNCNNEVKPMIHLTAFNPRFTYRVNWQKVIERFDKEDVVVMNLRRTNLVHMAYSLWKKDHRYNPHNVEKFDFVSLIKLVNDYTLGEQDVATVKALEAALTYEQYPYLVFYEDLLNSPQEKFTSIGQYLHIHNFSLVSKRKKKKFKQDLSKH